MAGNERIGALANDSARQRFNVAASRAQDQLWLFHSATLDVLSLSCMRHKLLSYMLSPSRQATPLGVVKFDSKFEKDVFQLISNKGFHVRTQVCVGDPTNHRYRIDLVVEGMQGRLAVECDGDHAHLSPERYPLIRFTAGVPRWRYLTMLICAIAGMPVFVVIGLAYFFILHLWQGLLLFGLGVYA